MVIPMNMEIMLVSQTDNLIDKVLKFNETVVKCALKQPFDIMGCIKENAHGFSPIFAAMKEFGVADTDLTLEDILIDGIVVDEDKAKSTPCKCIRYDGKDLCWSPGVIGLLRQDQIAKYCPTKHYEEKPKLIKHLNEFKKIAEETKGMPLMERIAMMKALLSKHTPETGVYTTSKVPAEMYAEDDEDEDLLDIPVIEPMFEEVPEMDIELDERLPFEDEEMLEKIKKEAEEL